MSISDIVADLYRHKPNEPLFHYTSLGGLLGIVKDAALHATDVRFLSDAAELGHTGNLLQHVIYAKPHPDPRDSTMLFQFLEWLRGRLLFGNMLFVVCFTADGNLLSQWRSYTKPSKGVSIGFDADKLAACASSQSFQLARCVYDPEEQRILAERFIEELK